ncbi:hypothetical protein HOLleu_42764 [Holothuria leucospilota]|uniref:Uncharacterized protein n=1 Tax=Holothuria leucospilota TaxID=206669 RepID=A0A9Q0YCE3_HOLLE|nr:hypothetical protein HOLleu_42764 [Holothuria leucospilota]
MSFDELDEIIRNHQNLNDHHPKMLFQRMCWLATGGSPVTLTGTEPKEEYDTVERMFEETELPLEQMNDQEALLLEWLVTGGENEGLSDEDMLSAILTLRPTPPSPTPMDSDDHAPSDPPRRTYVGRVNEGASTSGLTRGHKRSHDLDDEGLPAIQDDEEGHSDEVDLNNKELVDYCVSDVDILRRCCLLFRSLFMDITGKEIDNNVEDEEEEGDGVVTKRVGVDPFRHCITIASACNLVFRRNFMKPNSIAVFIQRQVRIIRTQRWNGCITKVNKGCVYPTCTK